MKKILLSLFSLCIILSLPAQEIKYPMGVLPGQDAAYEQMPEKAALTRNFGVSHQLKPAASLKDFSPTPGHQKEFGTCTGWATAYCARTILEAMKYDWTGNDYIATKAYSAGFQYRVISPTNKTCEGAFTGDCVNSLVTIGAIPENEFLSEREGGLCPDIPMAQKYYTLAAAHKIEDLARLWSPGFSNNAEKIKKIKQSIAENNPVVISMICPLSFLKAEKVWIPSDEDKNGDFSHQHGRHAMCVIGYDDNQFGGAVEVQNSWGTNWGNEGRMWIKYGDFAWFTYQAYEIIELPKPIGQESLFEGALRLVDINTNIDVPVRVAEETRNFTTKHSDGKYSYKSTKPYTSGTEIRMYLESKTPAFVYILGTGSKDTSIGTLFPEEGVSAALNYQENEIALPGEYSSFMMDETVGTDYLIVLFSKSKIDIQNLQSKLSEDTGHIADKLKRVLGDKLIASDHISYEREKIGFKVKQTPSIAGSIMAMVLAFEHIAK